MPPPVPAAPSHCPNCGDSLADRSPRAPARYCPNCGQETRIQAPTLREFAQQFGGAYFSTEGALWRTLRLLLTRPGELTRQYLAGRRKHYVLPLRLYLTISVVTLLLLRVLGGGAVRVEIKPDVDSLGGKTGNLTLLDTGTGRYIGLRGGVFVCERMPQWLCHRVERRIDLGGKTLPEQLEQFRDRFLSNLGGAMFLLLPSFALWLKLVYLNRRMRYTEHLVFALHLHAFWFLALALTVPDRWWLSTPAFVAVPWHTLLAMRRVYGGRRWPRLLRAGLVTLLYGLTLTAALAVVALWSLLT